MLDVVVGVKKNITLRHLTQLSVVDVRVDLVVKTSQNSVLVCCLFLTNKSYSCHSLNSSNNKIPDSLNSLLMSRMHFKICDEKQMMRQKFVILICVQTLRRKKDKLTVLRYCAAVQCYITVLHYSAALQCCITVLHYSAAVQCSCKYCSASYASM